MLQTGALFWAFHIFLRLLLPWKCGNGMRTNPSLSSLKWPSVAYALLLFSNIQWNWTACSWQRTFVQRVAQNKWEHVWHMRVPRNVLESKIKQSLCMCACRCCSHLCTLKLHKRGCPELEFRICGFFLPWEGPPPPSSTPDMPDTEHSSQTGDPTWRTASSMPIINWWGTLQPRETERVSLGSGMWKRGKKKKTWNTRVQMKKESKHQKVYSELWQQ